jgi:hypothetical protein
VIANLNKELKVFDWGWGAVDFAKRGAVEITDYSKSQGVKPTTTENQGGHDWRTWRKDLHRFAHDLPLTLRCRSIMDGRNTSTGVRA